MSERGRLCRGEATAAFAIQKARSTPCSHQALQCDARRAARGLPAATRAFASGAFRAHPSCDSLPCLILQGVGLQMCRRALAQTSIPRAMCRGNAWQPALISEWRNPHEGCVPDGVKASAVAKEDDRPSAILHLQFPFVFNRKFGRVALAPSLLPCAWACASGAVLLARLLPSAGHESWVARRCRCRPTIEWTWSTIRETMLAKSVTGCSLKTPDMALGSSAAATPGTRGASSSSPWCFRTSFSPPSWSSRTARKSRQLEQTKPPAMLASSPPGLPYALC